MGPIVANNAVEDITVTSSSTQTPCDISPLPISDEILLQSQHQNASHCVASFAAINQMRGSVQVNYNDLRICVLNIVLLQLVFHCIDIIIQLCDVILEADGEQINAHRVILASVSPYFYAMFNGKCCQPHRC